MPFDSQKVISTIGGFVQIELDDSLSTPAYTCDIIDEFSKWRILILGGH
jgi:hypothetical protein